MKYKLVKFQSLSFVMFLMKYCRIFLTVFKILRKFQKTSRLVAFPHLVEAESAPMDLQMELVKIKNDEQLVQKFKDEENLAETWKSAIIYPML